MYVLLFEVAGGRGLVERTRIRAGVSVLDGADVVKVTGRNVAGEATIIEEMDSRIVIALIDVLRADHMPGTLDVIE